MYLGLTQHQESRRRLEHELENARRVLSPWAFWWLLVEIAWIVFWGIAKRGAKRAWLRICFPWVPKELARQIADAEPAAKLSADDYDALRTDR